MTTPKVLTITLRFDIGERNTHLPRIKAASDAVVAAATEAAKKALLDGSVENVQATTTWDYRWAEFSETVPGATIDDSLTTDEVPVP
jgi:hypothetical protein